MEVGDEWKNTCISEDIVGGLLSHISNATNNDKLARIKDFVESSSGLQLKGQGEEEIAIAQASDGKSLSFGVLEVDEILVRADTDGQPFLQVNFVSGTKILLTQELIGFKPGHCVGLDMNKVPKVVTTPDLVSVVEAIEETMNTDEGAGEEIEVLRKVFQAVLKGAEHVGFDLSAEREWIQRISRISHRPSA